jgi:SAM-dependent methyltransferase
VAPPEDPYYRPDLALVHHRGFGFHALACAPGILALLDSLRSRNGLVLELGCGSGLLTRELTAAGHRVIATDASAAMLDLARGHAPAAADIRLLVLPGDDLPQVDAVVSVGHVLSYLPDEHAIDQALTAIARALRPGGLFAIDICDLAYGLARRDAPPAARVHDDWAIITRFSLPAPSRFVRQITTFVRASDGSWRRDDETHHNVLIDTAAVPALFAAEGVQVTGGLRVRNRAAAHRTVRTDRAARRLTTGTGPGPSPLRFELLSAFHDGIPGGPMISMPYSAARAVICAGSGGLAGGGGRVREWAGSAAVRMKASKPPGSVTSRKLAPLGELTVKVCGVPWGPNTNDPAGARMTWPPTQTVSSPSRT